MKLFALILLLIFSSAYSAHPKAVSHFFGGGQAYSYHLHIANTTGNAAQATPSPFTGWLGGFILGYEYEKPNHLYVVLQTSYALGEIATTGTGNNDRYIHDEWLDMRFGYPGVLSHDGTWTVTPYTGAGFRWNIQYRRPGTLTGLKFNYYKIYIPLGLSLNYTPNKSIDLGLDFEWMPDVLSMISLSSLSGSFWELERMNNYLVQLPLIFTFANHYALHLIPFWMHFEDGASIAITDAGVALDLQKQITNNWGGKIACSVKF